MNKKISIIIPVFNEEETIEKCLSSLEKQSYKNTEIIVVDDGSLDNSPKIISEHKVHFYKQDHKGPGSARNYGAKQATGEILVFVDADMSFDADFVKDLTRPILEGETIGTFSKNEMVANPENPWSVCWNLNKNLPPKRMLPENYPDEAPVFRAILKSEFDRVNGFETSGEYTDDWSLSVKLSVESTRADGAVYYHANPGSIGQIWHQARWIGKNRFISGTYFRRLKSFFVYNPISTLIIAMAKSLFYMNPRFIIFKFVYNFAILLSVYKSFFGEVKFK